MGEPMFLARSTLSTTGTLIAAVVSLGCGSPSGAGAPERSASVSVALAQEFPLRPGETAQLHGANLRLTFVEVLEDSRCPIDVVCVWAGNAKIQLHVRGVGTDDLELDTFGDTGGYARMVEFEGHRIHLVSLTNPNRALAERAPAPAVYTAMLRIERAPG